MAIDPRHLRPSMLTRMLNSTPLGEVINERQLHRHRGRAGYRIGDDRHVDLYRYTAWLALQRREPKREAGPADYEAMKEAARARNARLSAIGREIGSIPPVGDPARKEKAASDFRFFCEAYFPEAFCLPWSPDHLKVIAKIETAVLRGGLFAMAMPRGSGKALALDTPLPTPAGWKTMGDVQVGDTLFDDRGIQCRVTYATDVQHGRSCYRVAFSDGETIICDGEHLWTIHDRYARKNPKTLRTSDMAGRVVLTDKRGWPEHRYRIPLAEPIQTQGDHLPVPPYSLGVWLGNGVATCASVTNHSEDMAEFQKHIRRDGESLDARPSGDCGKGRCGVMTTAREIGNATPSFQARLRKAGVLGNKHIPAVYLRASVPDRLGLLQGLMDTDGSVARGGRCEITFKEGPLCDDMEELLASLGIKYGTSSKWVFLDGKRHGPYRRFNFSAYADRPVFLLRRKLDRLRPLPRRTPPGRHRFITAIEPVESVPVRCIQVDSPSRLYLAGRKMVPTHNTTLAETACIWAMLTGAREFVCLIGSDAGHARGMLESIKVEFETNERLLADYPEAVFPIHALERIHNRAKGQICEGKPTRIVWTADEIVLPTVTGSAAAGAIIRVAGIESRIRGMKFKRADGRAVRPSLVVLDDPQTDESARSPQQVQSRMETLNGAILNLGGPGQKISGIMPCTVIRPGDMADRILDRETHPAWQGERTKLIYRFPSNTKLWDLYTGIRADSFRNDGDGREATEFYREHREQMDEGAVIAWPERFNTDELSAIQHAMNLRIQDERAFYSEYQNEPLPDDEGESDQLTANQIAAKLGGYDRGAVPIGATHLTMFIDVQAKLLYYLVAAWENDFTGHVIDYGAWPDQQRDYFTLRDAQKTLARAAPGTGLEGAIFAGLERLTHQYLGRTWKREDGAEMRIGRCLVDANWGQSTDVVYQFCRQSAHAAVLMPSHGRYIGASSVPFSEYRRKRGERVGHHWRIPNVSGRRQVRHALIDTNYWKSFVQERLAVAMGDRGCLSLYGRKPEAHQLLAEHLTAEYRVRTEARGRVVDEWKLRAGAPDNHWLDCLVGCAVSASILGAELPSTGGSAPGRGSRLKLSEIQRTRK